VAIIATNEIPILPLRRGREIGNPGVKLEFHVWQ